MRDVVHMVLCANVATGANRITESTIRIFAISYLHTEAEPVISELAIKPWFLVMGCQLLDVPYCLVQLVRLREPAKLVTAKNGIFDATRWARDDRPSPAWRAQR